MSLVTILGIIGVVINWTLAIIGMPLQIRENLKRRNAEGLSTLNFSLLFWVFATSFLYGLSIYNFPLILGNALPLVFSGIILGQIMYYRKKNFKKSA